MEDAVRVTGFRLPRTLRCAEVGQARLGDQFGVVVKTADLIPNHGRRLRIIPFQFTGFDGRDGWAAVGIAGTGDNPAVSAPDEPAAMRRGQGAGVGDDGAMGDRLHLRRTFDSAASLYDRARPRYPTRLLDALVRHTGLRAGDHVLEVGGATGIATQPLAKRGLNVVCVELGEDLVRVARERLAAYPQVEVVRADFESWTPTRSFDLVMAATAWHWIDPSIRYQRAAEALRSGGHIAFWSATHVIPDDGDPFFDEIQDVYEEIGEGLAPGAPRPRPGRLPDSLEEIEHCGLFANAIALQFDWETLYSADGYIDLLNTFSGHIAMGKTQRDTLYSAIRDRIAQRPVPKIARHWGAVLHIAQRLDP